MADIRINALPTTASASSSDDYIALDGTTNGTRKLNAYSPTFGGNLTVSGTSALNGTVNTNGAKAVNVTPTMTPLSGNLYGLYVQPTINSGASAGGTVSGLTVAATNSGTSNITNIAGIEFIGGNGAASGSMQDLKAFRSSPINLSTGQIVNLYQFYATNAYNPSGTINTQYGLYVDALTSATTNYAIYTAGTAPSVLGGNLTVSGTGTSAFSGAIKARSGGADEVGIGPYGTGTGGIYFGNGTVSLFNDANTQLKSSVGLSLAGNLTVSGTGTSSFASGSKLGVGTTSPGVTFVAVGAPATLNYTIGSTSLADIRSTSAAATNAGPSLTFSGYYQTSVNTSTYGAIKGILQGAGDGNSAAGALTFLTANGAGSLSEWARLTNSGNLLLGTTTDSGNGKLQLATHSTSAGGIGFGTDVSLYRTTSNILTFGAGNACGFYLRDTNTSTNLSEFYSDTSQTFFGTKTALPLIIRTNNTTALTLDSSQNATFAKTVTASSTGSAAAKIGTGFAGFAEFSNATGFGAAGTYALIQDNTGETYLNTASGKSLFLRVANANALTITSTAATFAGSIAINNAVQTAVGVASTHKVTISIGGSTYYLLATNV